MPTICFHRSEVPIFIVARYVRRSSTKHARPVRSQLPDRDPRSGFGVYFGGMLSLKPANPVGARRVCANFTLGGNPWLRLASSLFIFRTSSEFTR
jgi:hypothetical protein